MTSRLAYRIPFLIVAAAVLLSAALYSPQRYGIWADQMTYYLQADSIAWDGDLRFDQRDLERFRRHGWPEQVPLGLYLREADGRFYYSKPFLYSLAAAPLTWVAPVRGPILLNALLWLILVEITFRWYRRFNSVGRAAAIAILAWVASVAPFYIFIIHTDLMIPTLLALGLYFWLTSKLEQEEPATGIDRWSWQTAGPNARSVGRLVLSGVFFGLAVYEKNPLFFFPGAAVASLLWKREIRAAGLVVVLVIVAFALPTLVHLSQDGNFSPYKGNRVYCDGNFPFDDLEAARTFVGMRPDSGSEFFERRLAQNVFNAQHLGQFARDLPRNLGFYLVGRKTGLFPYLTPALLALFLWLALRQWRGEGWPSVLLLAAIVAYILFYFLILSAYYGGPAALGNRYASQILPAFLLMIRKLPGGRRSFAALVVVLAAAGLYFPGPDLLPPYGKIRDNMALFQKPRFRPLPLEWHLIWFMPDTTASFAGLQGVGKLVRLTDLNPTFDPVAYFTPGRRHEVAVLSVKPVESIRVRLAARSAKHEGWVRSGSRTLGFALGPCESRLLDIPLSLRGKAHYRRLEVYCYLVEFAIDDSPEPNDIYPAEYFDRLGLFIDWEAVDELDGSEALAIVPDKPRHSGRLLWGWHAPEPRDAAGMQRRWAGEALESAVSLGTIDMEAPVLRIEAECPIPIETEVIWNGRSLGTHTIGPGAKTLSFDLTPGEVRLAENILCLRHDRLWRPADFTPGKEDPDNRMLAVHYSRIEVVSGAEDPSTSPRQTVEKKSAGSAKQNAPE